MKMFPLLLVAFCTVSIGRAQTNSAPYVPKTADMRIVEGKMYNRELSTNWTTLPAAEATLEVVEVIPEGVVVESKVKGVGEKILVKHYPGEKKLAKGQTIMTSFRAMKVEGVKDGNATVAAYDCGLSNTKENRKTLKNGEVHGAQ